MSIQQVKNLINGEIIAKNISKIAWYMSIQHCHHYFWNYWNETQRIQAYKIKECRSWENYSKCDANCSPVVFYLLLFLALDPDWSGQKNQTRKEKVAPQHLLRPVITLHFGNKNCYNLPSSHDQNLENSDKERLH